MSKKYKNILEFLDTCSEDEQNYIYDFYNDIAVSDLIDMLFEYMPPEDTIAEIENYRREKAEEYGSGEIDWNNQE